jgi:hypothetical protein
MTWKIVLGIGLVGVLMLITAGYLNRRARAVVASKPIDFAALHKDVTRILGGGDRARAIRIYRERTGAGILQARDAVERIARGGGG